VIDADFESECCGLVLMLTFLLLCMCNMIAALTHCLIAYTGLLSAVLTITSVLRTICWQKDFYGSAVRGRLLPTQNNLLLSLLCRHRGSSLSPLVIFECNSGPRAPEARMILLLIVIPETMVVRGVYYEFGLAACIRLAIICQCNEDL